MKQRYAHETRYAFHDTIQLLGESLCIFKHATRDLLPILRDSPRSDVNCASIQLFSRDSQPTGATKPILSREDKTRPVTPLLIHSWSGRAEPSRADLLSLPHNLHSRTMSPDYGQGRYVVDSAGSNLRALFKY